METTPTNRRLRVVLIGSGNVATSLAPVLRSQCELVQIYSRTLANAELLARANACALWTDNLDALVDDADVYVIAVKDDAIADVIHSHATHNGLWVHTSGTKPLSLFPGYRKRYGVMYPLQTFSRQVAVDMNTVHMFVEGNTPDTTRQIADFARLITPNVKELDSAGRARLHLAAVFACNFANHMWTLADEILHDDGLSIDVLRPLIDGTVSKLDSLSPAESQTGPAARADREVIRRQLAMLSGIKHDVYDVVTRSIIKTKRKQDKK